MLADSENTGIQRRHKQLLFIAGKTSLSHFKQSRFSLHWQYLIRRDSSPNCSLLFLSHPASHYSSITSLHQSIIKMFRPIHYFGCFLLFVASILLLVTTISAPVINSISVMRVDLGRNASSLTFGTFGYCVLNSEQGGDWCTGREIGYDVSNIMVNAERTGFSEASGNTADGLTRVMVLHPVACALTFISFLIACAAGIIGSLIGVIVAFVAWVITLVVMATDFAAFGIVKNDVNEDGSGSVAYYGSAMWCLLAAFVLQFFGMVIVFFTCCTSRREKRRNQAAVEPKNDYGVSSRRSRWGRWRRN